MNKREAIKLGNTLIQLIAEIDEFKGKWQLLGKLAPEQLHALKRVATIESVGSSTRIEGATLSDKQVEELLSGAKTYLFTSRDEQEVAGYAGVMEEIFASWEHIPFTENYIKQLHAMLLAESKKDQRHRGQYKKFPNHVEAFDASGKSLGVVFKTASPFDTIRFMQELILWVEQTMVEKTMHPLIVIAICIVEFLAIHPFQDGNGRLSRVLTTLLLLKYGYEYVPYCSLESIVEENKDAYYLALRRTQGTLKTDDPNYEPWLLFFLRALQKQKNRLEQKIAYERVMVDSVSELSAQILSVVKERGKVTTALLVKVTNANRSTLKFQLRKLVEQKYLTRHGAGRGTWYTLAK